MDGRLEDEDERNNGGGGGGFFERNKILVFLLQMRILFL
jgi:hypothetical protein